MSTARKQEPGHADDEYDLTEEEEAELEESIGQFERGDWVDWDDIREERRRRGELTADELKEFDAVIEKADRDEKLTAPARLRLMRATREVILSRRQ